jgi:hypothetical protein
MTMATLWISCLCLPATLAGAWIGARVHVSVSAQTFQTVVLFFLLLGRHIAWRGAHPLMRIAAAAIDGQPLSRAAFCARAYRIDLRLGTRAFRPTPRPALAGRVRQTSFSYISGRHQLATITLNGDLTKNQSEETSCFAGS